MREKTSMSLLTATPDILCCCTCHESENCHNAHVSTHIKKENLILFRMLQLTVRWMYWVIFQWLCVIINGGSDLLLSGLIQGNS
jgi:hypothetical protein